MKYLSTLILSIFLCSCLSYNCITGEGEKEKSSRDLKEFTELSINLNADIQLKKRAQPGIEMEAYQNLLDIIEIEEDDNTLKVSSEKCIESETRPLITVYFSDLEALKINSSAHIFSKDTLNGDFELSINGSGDAILPCNLESLEVKINGSGDIKVSGSSRETVIKINGSGDIDALALLSEKAEVKINGSGDVRLHVLDELDTKITGSGDVRYQGSPNVVSHIMGSGDIRAITKK